MSETTKKRETRAAKQFNAERVVASGATPWAKEDMESEHFLYQHKEAKGATHTVKYMDLRALRRNAVDLNKNPVYVLDFSGDVWCMIPKIQFDIYKDEF